jgi:hypothetical protein
MCRAALVFLLMLASLPVSAGDLELNLPIAKIGSGYGFDYQQSARCSFGVEGGKWADHVYYLGPTLDYGVGPFSLDIAMVAVNEHWTRGGLIPEAQYQYKRWSFDINYLWSKGNSGFGFSIGFHL